MTSFPSTNRRLCNDHESLVERTLCLLSGRRALVVAPPRGSRQPTNPSPHQALLEVIERVREGALVSADARARVMHAADELGIRAFDASMMIALTQDRVRRGESTREIPRLLQARPSTGGDAPSACARTDRTDALSWIGVATTGLFIAVLIAGWFSG